MSNRWFPYSAASLLRTDQAPMPRGWRPGLPVPSVAPRCVPGTLGEVLVRVSPAGLLSGFGRVHLLGRLARKTAGKQNGNGGGAIWWMCLGGGKVWEGWTCLLSKELVWDWYETSNCWQKERAIITASQNPCRIGTLNHVGLPPQKSPPS